MVDPSGFDGEGEGGDDEGEDPFDPLPGQCGDCNMPEEHVFVDRGGSEGPDTKDDGKQVAGFENGNNSSAASGGGELAGNGPGLQSPGTAMPDNPPPPSAATSPQVELPPARSPAPQSSSSPQGGGPSDYARGWAAPQWSPRAEGEFAKAQAEYRTQRAIGRSDAVLLPRDLPPDLSIADVIKQGGEHFANPLWFANQVRTGGPWDFKNRGGLNNHPEWEDAGNFVYGVGGRAVGFSLETLREGAGFVHAWNGASQSEFGSWLQEPFHGDGPDDQFWMEEGSRAFDLLQGRK